MILSKPVYSHLVVLADFSILLTVSTFSLAPTAPGTLLENLRVAGQALWKWYDAGLTGRGVHFCTTTCNSCNKQQMVNKHW